MPRTEEQNKTIREQKIDLIKKTALHLFAEEGYYNTSVQKIAKTARISKGLLYNYFESKENLLKAIVEDFFNRVYNYFDPNHDDILSDEEFLFFIEKNFDVIKENPIQWKLYTSLSTQKDVTELLTHLFTRIRTRIYNVMLNFFKEKNCKDPQIELLFFSSLLKGAIIQYVAAPDNFPIEIMKNKIIDFYKEKFKI